jgi:hypothetical protein
MMAMLFAFAPFIGFAVVTNFAGSVPGLVCGALIAAGVLARDCLVLRKAPKVLEIGTFILFGALAVVTVLGVANWSILGVRLRVDAGLFLIVLVSIAIRRPFTLQYAREQTEPAIWQSPVFIRTNYIITAAWALAFLVMVAADLVMLYMPNVPTYVGVVATVAAIVGAIRFTNWYPEHLRARLAG